nr:MAG TPA: Large polyvalent protein associated domain 23 [Caudoviricetes sp.]
MPRNLAQEYLNRRKRAEEAKKKGEKRQADIIVERADKQIDNIINKANQTVGQYVPGVALRRLEKGTQGGYPQRTDTRRNLAQEYLHKAGSAAVEKAKAKAGQINSAAVKSAYKQVRKDANEKAARHVAVNTTAPLDFAEAGRYRAKFLSGRSVDKVQREYDTTRERAEEYRQKALHLRETGDAQREASSTTATGKDREDATRFGSSLTRSADQWDKLAQEESSKALELARELGYAKVYQVQKTEADIVSKPDFEQKSEADPKVLELGNEENRPKMSRATAIYGGINHSPYFETRGSETFMTDEEVKIFTYLYNTKGEKAAEQYYDMLSDTLELRRGTEKAAGLDNTVERTLFSLSQGVRRFGRGIEQLFTDEQLPLYGEDYAENIINASASRGERILYSAANSIGNMLPMVAISAATQGIGGAVGLSAEAAQAAGKAAGVASMFAGAKGNAYTEAMQQGMTKAQASTYSTLVGASEAGLEYLIGGISRFSMGSGIGDFVQEAISGLGRGYARVAFRFAGSLIGGSIDEIIEENTQNYLEPLFINYVTGKEAEMPGWDEFIETTLSTLITTGVMESRGSFAEAKRNIAFTPFEAQLEWVSAAKNVFAEGTDVAEFADVLESHLQAGDPMSYKEFREGIRALGVDEKTMGRIAKGKLTVDEVLTSTENGDKISLKEWQAGQNSTAQQGQSQTQRAETVQAENNNVEAAMTAAEQEADRLIAEWNRGENSSYELGQQAQRVMQQLEEEVREGTATDPGSYMNRQIQLQEIVRSAPEASTAQQATQNTTEGIDNNGRTEILNDSAERNAGLGAGEQAGAVAEGAGRPVAGGAGTQTQNGRADLSGGREAVSAREIGVKGGTAEKNIHVVIPSEIDTARAEDAALVEKMNRIVVEAAAKGQDVTFVSGAITVESGNRTVRVEGVRQTGDNGRTQIYLQVDGRRDMERIYRHEDFHDAVEAQPGLLQRLADRLMQEYGREEMLRMAIDYAEAYDGIYGEFTEDMTEEQENELAVRYMEEVFADAYAGIRRGQRRIRSAQKTLENSGEIETLRARGQTAQNAQEEQNGKFSLAGQKARTANSQTLQIAEQMEQEGASREEIWQETGWTRTMDGKNWRFEIDNSEAEYRGGGDAQFREAHADYAEYQDLLQKMFEGTISESEMQRMEQLDDIWSGEYARLRERVESGNATLADVLQHDSLYEAYPELRDVKVRLESDTGSKNGSYDPRTNTITISEDKPGDSAKVGTMLHEIQHAIQQIEGWESGASPEYWAAREYESGDTASDRAQELYSRILNSLDKADQNKVIRYNELDREMEATFSADPESEAGKRYAKYEAEQDKLYEELYKNEWFRRLLDLQRQMENPQSAYYEMYLNTAGEIEARNVSERYRMAQEERRKTAPKGADEDTLYKGSEWTRAMDEDPERSKIKDQIRGAQDELNEMKVATSIQAPENLRGRQDTMAWVQKVLPNYHGSVDTKLLGKVTFEKEEIAAGLRYAKTPEERAAIATVPMVLKRGIEVGEHSNHKGRKKHTVTIAAPVEINGVRGNVGVVVSMSNGKYYAHRILLPNGEMFQFGGGKKNEAARGPQRGVTVSGSLANATSAASRGSIAQNKAEVKGKFSVSDDLNELNQQVQGAEAATRSDALKAQAEAELQEYLKKGKSELAQSISKMSDAALKKQTERVKQAMTAESEGLRVNEAAEAMTEGVQKYAESRNQRLGDMLQMIKTEQNKRAAAKREAEKQRRAEARKTPEAKLQRKVDKLQKQIDIERAALRQAKQGGTLTREMAEQSEERIMGLRQELLDYKNELQEKKTAAREEKKRQQDQAAKEAIQKEKPRQATRDLTNALIESFNVPEENRTQATIQIRELAEQAYQEGQKGPITNKLRNKMLDTLIELGTEREMLDNRESEISQRLREKWIQVPDEVRTAFGEEWADIKESAYDSGIYFTYKDGYRSIQSWTAELQKEFGQMFDTTRSLQQQLRDIVNLASEGYGKQMTIGDMIRQNADDYSWSMREKVEELGKVLDDQLQRFGEKANIEVKLAARSAKSLQAQQQYFENRLRSRTEQQMESLAREKLLKSAKQLSRMANKSSAEQRAAIQKVIGNIDLVARSITPDGIENLQELALSYRQAMEAMGENFIRDKDVEDRLARLDKKRIDNMDDMDEVRQLAQDITAVATQIRNRNQMLATVRRETVSEMAENVRKEVKAAKGSNAGKARDFVLMQTDAKRFFLELGGWKEDGATAELLHGLERGEEKRRLYEMRAQGLFNGFLADKANKKWVESATGKDAQWITVDTPRGAAVIKDGTASAINELTMTPMMRVSLVMHSKNEDNLRHIAEGGMRVPNRALYKKGNISEAYARGDVVTLTPQAVRDIVRGATAQEIQFAAILSKYFDGQAKNAINEVSMIMDGYEKAMVKNYFPLESDRAFTVQDNDQVRNDISLTGLGFLKQRTGKGANPVLLQDASQTFQRSVESVSKYYGLALPIRDLNAVMNSTYYENAGKVRLSQTDKLLGRDRSKEGGGAIRTQSAESVRNVIAGKWGKSSINYIEKLVGDLQRSGKDMDAFSGFFGWLRGQYASAVISFNPSSMLKQWGSYATAMAYLSPGDLAAGLLRGMKGKVSTDTLGQYSSVYWYRNQGNATQELHDLTTNEALVTKLPLGYNWAQAMDSFITRRLMLACERNVSRTTGLTPGTSEEINSGTDAYWTKVATLFNKVVLDTQSNSSILERAAVARANPNNISRFMTMFRADAFQSFNLLREGQGKYQTARAAYLQNKTAENRRAMIAARKQLARSGAAVIASQLVSASISVMLNALRRRDELWDEDGLNWGEVMKQLGLGMVEGLAGISIAGEELVGLVESIAFDETWYGPDVNALQLLTDTAESAISAAQILKNGKWELAPGALKDLALEASTVMGMPLKNVEKYVQVLPRWIAPELMAEYDNIWDEVDRNALSKSSVLDIKADIGVLLDNRTEDMRDEDKEELTRLYLAGGTGALPAAVPNSVKYTNDSGEEVTVQLDYSQKQTYKKEWSKIVSGAIGSLLKSDLYNEADDKTKTKMLNNLYTYANGLSAEKVVPEKAADGWIDDARTISGEGVKIADYIQWHTMLSEMDSDDASGTSRTGLKNARALELANEKGWTWAVPSDAPDELKWMEDDTEQTLQLTDAQKKQYRKTWTGIVYGSVGDLMQSDEYQSGSEKERGALIQKLTSYASALAAYEIEPKKVPDTWISGGQQAVKDGVPLDEYIVFRALYSELDSINEDGDEESGLKNKRTLDLIESMGWSDKAEQSAYINTVASESKAAEAEALQKAGMTWEQANDVLAVPGTGVAKKAAVTATNASEATKAKVLASYDKSEKQKTAKLVMTGLKYGIPMRRYTDVLQNADADGSGGVSQEEAGKYIATLGLSVQEAAYLWQMITNGKEGKKNPFSSYFGSEFYSAAGAFD